MSNGVPFVTFRKTLQTENQTSSYISYRLSHIAECLRLLLSTGTIWDWSPDDCDEFISSLLVAYITRAVNISKTWPNNLIGDLLSQIEIITNVLMRGVISHKINATILVDVCSSVTVVGKSEIIPVTPALVGPLMKMLPTSEPRNIGLFELVFMYRLKTQQKESDDDNLVSKFLTCLESDAMKYVPARVLKRVITRFQTYMDQSGGCTPQQVIVIIRSVWMIFTSSGDTETRGAALDILQGYSNSKEFEELARKDNFLLRLIMIGETHSVEPLIPVLTKHTAIGWSLVRDLLNERRNSPENFGDSFFQNFSLALTFLDSAGAAEIMKGIKSTSSPSISELEVFSMFCSAIAGKFSDILLECSRYLSRKLPFPIPDEILDLLLPALTSNPSCRRVFLNRLIETLTPTSPFGKTFEQVLSLSTEAEVLDVLGVLAKRGYQNLESLRMILPRCKLPLPAAALSHIFNLFTDSPQGWRYFTELYKKGKNVFSVQQWSLLLTVVENQVLCEEALNFVQLWNSAAGGEEYTYCQIKTAVALIDNYLCICPQDSLDQVFRCFFQVLASVPIEEKVALYREILTSLLPDYRKIDMVRSLQFVWNLIWYTERLIPNEKLGFVRFKAIRLPHSFTITLTGNPDVALRIAPDVMVRDIVNVLSLITRHQQAYLSLEVNGKVLDPSLTVAQSGIDERTVVHWTTHSTAAPPTNVVFVFPSAVLVELNAGPLVGHGASRVSWVFDCFRDVGVSRYTEVGKLAWRILKMLPPIEEFIRHRKDEITVFQALMSDDGTGEKIYYLHMWLESLKSPKFASWFRDECLPQLQCLLEQDLCEPVLVLILKILLNPAVLNRVSCSEAWVTMLVNKFLEDHEQRTCLLILLLFRECQAKYPFIAPLLLSHRRFVDKCSQSAFSGELKAIITQMPMSQNASKSWGDTPGGSDFPKMPGFALASADYEEMKVNLTRLYLNLTPSSGMEDSHALSSQNLCDLLDAAKNGAPNASDGVVEKLTTLIQNFHDGPAATEEFVEKILDIADMDPSDITPTAIKNISAAFSALSCYHPIVSKEKGIFQRSLSLLLLVCQTNPRPSQYDLKSLWHVAYNRDRKNLKIMKLFYYQYRTQMKNCQIAISDDGGNVRDPVDLLMDSVQGYERPDDISEFLVSIPRVPGHAWRFDLSKLTKAKVANPEVFAFCYLNQDGNEPDEICQTGMAPNQWYCRVIAFLSKYFSQVRGNLEKLRRCCSLALSTNKPDITHVEFYETLVLELYRSGEICYAMRVITVCYPQLPIEMTEKILKDNLGVYISLVCQSNEPVFVDFFDALESVFIHAPKLLEMLVTSLEFRTKAQRTPYFMRFIQIACKLTDNASTTTAVAVFCAKCAANCLTLFEPMKYVLDTRSHIKMSEVSRYYMAFIRNLDGLKEHMEEIATILNTLVIDCGIEGFVTLEPLFPYVWEETSPAICALFYSIIEKNKALARSGSSSIMRAINSITTEVSWKQRYLLLKVYPYSKTIKSVVSVGNSLFLCAKDHPGMLHEQFPGKCLDLISSYIVPENEMHISWSTALYMTLMAIPDDDPNVNKFIQSFWRTLAPSELSRVASMLSREVAQGGDDPGMFQRRQQLFELCRSVLKLR